jgi:hypothetical protein
MRPKYYGRFDPVYPCRVLETRHCPAPLNATCKTFCARFEANTTARENAAIELWRAEFESNGVDVGIEIVSRTEFDRES